MIPATRRWDPAKLPPRVALLQRELDARRRPRYLEIGAHKGRTFLSVEAPVKVAVDPVRRFRERTWRRPLRALRTRFVEATSDEFFASLGPKARFDVVFVDGLHTYEQALRDAQNAVERLAEDGVVVMHDCFPPSAASAERDPTAARAAGAEAWCGDTWKAVAHLRATRPDLIVETLDTDLGLAVVRLGASETIDLDPSDLPAMGYEDLIARPHELLGLRAAASICSTVCATVLAWLREWFARVWIEHPSAPWAC